MRRSSAVAVVVAVVASVLTAGCSGPARRREQSEVLRDTCASLAARATGFDPGLIADLADGETGPFLLSEGQTAERRAVDVLIERCLPGPG